MSSKDKKHKKTDSSQLQRPSSSASQQTFHRMNQPPQQTSASTPNLPQQVPMNFLPPYPNLAAQPMYIYPSQQRSSSPHQQYAYLPSQPYPAFSGQPIYILPSLPPPTPPQQRTGSAQQQQISHLTGYSSQPVIMFSPPAPPPPSPPQGHSHHHKHKDSVSSKNSSEKSPRTPQQQVPQQQFPQQQVPQQMFPQQQVPQQMFPFPYPQQGYPFFPPPPQVGRSTPNTPVKKKHHRSRGNAVITPIASPPHIKLNVPIAPSNFNQSVPQQPPPPSPPPPPHIKLNVPLTPPNLNQSVPQQPPAPVQTLPPPAPPILAPSQLSPRPSPNQPEVVENPYHVASDAQQEAPKDEIDDHDLALKLLNAFRAQNGKSKVKYSKKLSSIAQAHAAGMSVQMVPVGHSGFDNRVKKAKKKVGGGDSAHFSENVGQCVISDKIHPVQMMHDKWVQTPEQRTNMLDDVKLVGFAFVQNRGRAYGVQFFKGKN